MIEPSRTTWAEAGAVGSSAPRDDEPTGAAPYAHPYEHLSDALRLLDLRLRRRMKTFRRTMRALDAGEQPHLFVSHDTVDRILRDDTPAVDPGRGEDQGLREVQDAFRERVQARVQASLAAGVPLTLPALARRFGLSSFELQAVVLCLAPELRRTYDRVYAYLQDDVTRQRPSIDLVLDVLCDDELDRWEARALLEASAPLRYAEILHATPDPQSPSGSSGLAHLLRLDTRILQYVLGHSALDPVLEGVARLHRVRGGAEEETAWRLPVSASQRDALQRRVLDHIRGAHGAEPLVLHLHGPCGVGRRALASNLADAMGRALLCVDAASVHGSRQADGGHVIERAVREARLLDVPLYVANAERWRIGEEQGLLQRLEHAVEAYSIITILASDAAWTSPYPFEACTVYEVACRRPDAREQTHVWRDALKRWGLGDIAADGFGRVATGKDPSARLAGRFQLTPGQIRDAVQKAVRQVELEESHSDAVELPFETLAAAARGQAAVRLGELAMKVEPRATWSDLVLPADTRAKLLEIEEQVRHRTRVYDEWGFGRALRYGKGLSALFSGRPGTGKTMAAEVMAGSLQLDLYAVDLSQVVSKYIGETEKNLSRIFREAEDSNAILFFDEADALFGKRTEISDAHDRYANVETSYLLQRMEAYDGMVILASNLRENMDDAFLRRIRFVVEFPFPDAAQRLEIWRAHVPDAAPVADEVDFGMLADQMQVAGGNIKNIMLNAAFFAAANGQVIGMEHILRGARREYEKIGKLWDEEAILRRLASS